MMDYAIDDKWVGRFGLLILVILTVRTVLVFRATGRFPIRFHDTATAHGFNLTVLSLTFLVFALNLLVMRIPQWLSLDATHSWAGMYHYTAPIHALATDTVRLTGLLVAGLGLLLAAVAQHQMGESWRYGLDTAQGTKLVTTGFFSHARHPIYFGFFLVGLGLFLAMPSALTAAALAVLGVVLSIQTRLEEDFLLKSHGQAYESYYARTRRWI